MLDNMDIILQILGEKKKQSLSINTRSLELVTTFLIGPHEH